jgi:hypothetical protein
MIICIGFIKPADTNNITRPAVMNSVRSQTVAAQRGGVKLKFSLFMPPHGSVMWQGKSLSFVLFFIILFNLVPL